MTKLFRCRVMLAVVFTAVRVAGAYAQPVAAEQHPLAEQYIDTTAGLSLADAIAGALEREPSLRASRAELDAARAMRRQATLRSNPTLSLERREEPAGTDNQTMVQASVPLELFRRSARVDVAQRELEVTEQAVADRTRMLVNDIKMRYGQASAAARDVAVADNLAVSGRRDLELLGRRVDVVDWMAVEREDDVGVRPPLERATLFAGPAEARGIGAELGDHAGALSPRSPNVSCRGSKPGRGSFSIDGSRTVTQRKRRARWLPATAWASRCTCKPTSSPM